MKHMIRTLLDRFGLELRRTRAGTGFPSDPYLAQQHFMQRSGFASPVVFDVGAHKGETAARYRRLFPDARIWCFEAFPESAEALRRRFVDDEDIHVIAAAVSDEAGSRTLHVNNHDATNSLLPRNQAGRRYYHSQAGERKAIEVDAVTLDGFTRRQGIEQVDILKLDIQGGELMAFEGAKGLLENNSVGLVYTETLFVPHYENNPLFNELWNHLARHGYSLFDLYELYRARNGQLRFADALFVSPSFRHDVIDQYVEEP